MQGTMKAAVMTGVGKTDFITKDIPSAGDGEVLVKLEYVGICGSDVHYYETGAIGDFVVKPPFVLGHEAGGTVVETGKNVTHLKPGDRVALEPGKTCGECEFCKSGRYNLCPDVIFFATPPINGVFQEYVAHQASLCFKLPDNVSTLEGALIEPLAVGMHAAVQGGVTLGSSVIILGAGCIGLVTLLACKAYGATDITVVDVMEKRLDFARRLGATRTIQAKSEDVIKRMDELTAGSGTDVVIETAGSKTTISQTPYLVKRGGTIVLVGLAADNIIEYNFAKIMNKEASIKSVFRYRNLYPKAIEAVSKGFLDISGIVTHTFAFRDLPSALDTAIHQKNDVVKAVISFCSK